MKEAKVYKTLPLDGTNGGELRFAVVNEPYGDGSKPVVSVEVFLGEGQVWKIHVPLTQVKEVRKALKGAKSAYKDYKKDSKKKEKEKVCSEKKCKKEKKQDEAKD